MQVPMRAEIHLSERLQFQKSVRITFADIPRRGCGKVYKTSFPKCVKLRSKSVDFQLTTGDKQRTRDFLLT